MKKIVFQQLICITALFLLCSYSPKTWSGTTPHTLNDTTLLVVPLGGNSWLTQQAPQGREQVNKEGWQNWENEKAVFSTYIRLSKPGSMKLSVRLNVPEGESKIKCTVNGISKIKNIKGPEQKEHALGEWTISNAGYVRIDMQGVAKTGKVFANAGSLLLTGTAVDTQAVFVRSNDDNYFYWGRRGPSVHINYETAAADSSIEWFYNEITVPAGNDVIGSYFMASGFAEGYFGMQVNSATERRILFSVWSPFNTDDPSSIPDDKKIKLLKKGKDVHTGEFGNEGSGGQSYLRYNWKAGETCKFLLHAQPDSNNHTKYTAYFYAAEQQKWLLIASFSRPYTHTYLKRLHSFLENFEPSTGYIPRKALYHNQWIKETGGDWKPVTTMRFTADATARKGYRLDYAGGVDEGKFFLKNCGFFNENTPMKTVFSVPVLNVAPGILFSALE